MPARELGGAFEAPRGAHTISTNLLRKHKVLPHPRDEPEFSHSPPAIKPRGLKIDTGISVQAGSEPSSPRTLKHASKRIGGLPPTPPTHSRQSSTGYSAPSSASAYETPSLRSPIEIASGPSTPPNQRSPPTPDVTPPRGMPLAYRPPVRPAPTERYPSSTTRTDSFKTARENPYSSEDDDEDVSTVRPILPSARGSASTIPQIPQRSQQRKEVGLGLGLESEGTSTPRPREKTPQEEFVVFDGEWGSTVEETSEVEREWDDNLMRNVTVRKRRAHPAMITNGVRDEVVEDDIVSPTNATKVVRKLPLQGKLGEHQLQRDRASRASAERLAWSAKAARPESPNTTEMRRLSTMSAKSGTSAVIIDAFVVDVPIQRRKTLRHRKKQTGLRNFSSASDQSTFSSAPTSIDSRDHPHRLIHKKAELPQPRHRSLASNVTTSTTSSSGQSRRDVIKDGGIPVAVIPERRSSAKSSKTPSLRSMSSRKTKRSMSLNSAPLSNSAKFNEPGYFDIARHIRTASESASSSARTIDLPPHIPFRRSSLSAPTSKNNSRAGSLTTESLHAHNLMQAQKHEVQEPKEKMHDVSPQLSTQPETTKERSRPSIDHNGDPFFGSRLSAQATPFSQTSYETNGTSAEVSEAMAVNIFPHKNNSVLVVQHENSPVETTTKEVEELPIQKPAQPTMAVNDEPTTGPVTPPQESHPMDEVDSPLRNPRDAPEPPVLKFIPPTPAGLSPGNEEDRQLGYDPNEQRPTTSDSKPKRGLSLVRRALSNRRHSDSSPPSRGISLRRTLSLSGKRKESVDGATQTSKGEANPTSLYPTVADRPPDGTKLHPFWRPTHFWDDLEGYEDEDYGEDGYRMVYPMIDNRPAPPKRSLSGKLKRTFAILPIQDDDHYEWNHPVDRRTMQRTASGSMRVVKQRSQSSLRRRGNSSPPTYRHHKPALKEGDFGYGFQDGNGGKRGAAYLIPGLGIRVEYIGWNGLKRRLNERRREQRSEKLRGIISSPRGVQNGVDDVLRRKHQT
ncbi:hypothetical protein BP6252_04430 [Coleophoma cylindrospora]|uniref:Uncharacterized protein n=1 Tax=Coleophoma cylindrospora TaxID=1849047 RepID=A0A3D8S0F7_9HELO|nr:hypothetical protein BP6252_04430 [Coleophoma cylindrospora]